MSKVTLQVEFHERDLVDAFERRAHNPRGYGIDYVEGAREQILEDVQAAFAAHLRAKAAQAKS